MTTTSIERQLMMDRMDSKSFTTFFNKVNAMIYYKKINTGYAKGDSKSRRQKQDILAKFGEERYFEELIKQYLPAKVALETYRKGQIHPKEEPIKMPVISESGRILEDWEMPPDAEGPGLTKEQEEYDSLLDNKDLEGTGLKWDNGKLVEDEKVKDWKRLGFLTEQDYQNFLGEGATIGGGITLNDYPDEPTLDEEIKEALDVIDAQTIKGKPEAIRDWKEELRVEQEKVEKLRDIINSDAGEYVKLKKEIEHLKNKATISQAKEVLPETEPLKVTAKTESLAKRIIQLQGISASSQVSTTVNLNFSLQILVQGERIVNIDKVLEEARDEITTIITTLVEQNSKPVY